jgi:hypothetical protein
MCPGSGFDWTLLEKEMRDRGITYKRIDKLAYKLL